MGKGFDTILDNRLAFIEEAFETQDEFNGGFKKKNMTSGKSHVSITWTDSKTVMPGQKAIYSFY